MSSDIPWSWSTSASGVQAIPGPPPGYVLRVRGLCLTASAFTSVSSGGSLALAGCTAGTGSTATLNFDFQPSTTEGTALPVDFGEAGVVFAAPGTLILSEGGTPGLIAVSLWGAFTPLGA